MNKRGAVEFLYQQGFTAEATYDKLWERYPDLTPEWVQEVFEELDDGEDDPAF